MNCVAVEMLPPIAYDRARGRSAGGDAARPRGVPVHACLFGRHGGQFAEFLVRRTT